MCLCILLKKVIFRYIDNVLIVMNTTFSRIAIVFMVSVVLINTYLMNVFLNYRAPTSAKSLSRFHIETIQVETSNVTLSKMPSNQSSLSTTSNQLVFRDLGVLILACNRQTALDYALLSLSMAHYSKQTSVYVSIDCMPGVQVDTEKMEVFFKTITIWNSKQRFKKEKGEMAWRKDERVARHWIEAVTKVLEIHTHVLYMEEDHIVHPSILRDAFTLLAYQEENCSTCFSVQMGCHADCWGMKSKDSRHIVRMEPGNMGVIYSREKWKWFLKYHLKDLCTYYGSWDVLMHHVLFKSNQFMHSLTYLNPRVLHHNLCTSDRTSDVLHCDVDQLKVVFKEFTSQEIGLMNGLVTGDALGDGLIDHGIAHFSNMIIPEKSLSIADEMIFERCMQSILVSPKVVNLKAVSEKQGEVVELNFDAYDFEPFTVIGVDEEEIVQTSRITFERELPVQFDGEIWHLQNEFISVPLAECGPKSKLGDFKTVRSSFNVPVYEKVAIALAPEVWSWQHFMQDSMPKIVMMLDLGLLDQSRPLLLPPPRDPIIEAILSYLNLTWAIEPRTPPSFYAKDIMIACHLPGSNPRLWRRVNHYLTSSFTTLAWPKRHLVYVSRQNAKNGRIESNYAELHDMLLKTYPGTVKAFKGGNLATVMETFGGAAIILGSHGGGMHNLFFAPKDACVIEQQGKWIVEYNKNKEVIHRFSSQIGQRYIRVVRLDGSYDFHLEHLKKAVLLALD